MKKYTLNATTRTVFGKKVKNLRAAGELPATIYGKSLKSESITVNRDAFVIVYRQAGETGLIDLSVEKKTHPVLVHDVQIDPVSDAILNIEFHEVDLKEKVHAKIRLELTGESPAVEQKLGVLLTVHDSIEVEGLPSELPEKIVVDVSVLAELNQELTPANLRIPSGITVLTDMSLTLVKIGPLVTKAAEAQAATEATEAAEASATAEGAPVPAEGDAPAKPEEAPKTEK